MVQDNPISAEEYGEIEIVQYRQLQGLGKYHLKVGI